MNRRSAYLLTWGIVYIVLGLALLDQSDGLWIWEIHFGGAGVLSLLAAATNYRWLDTAGFVALSMSSAARSAWFVYDIIQATLNGHSIEYGSATLGAIIWAGVAVAQVIVAGWPIHQVGVEVDSEDGDIRGVR